MKPCALLWLDFLTSAGNKFLHSLVRKSSFSTAKGLHETGTSCVDLRTGALTETPVTCMCAEQHVCKIYTA